VNWFMNETHSTKLILAKFSMPWHKCILITEKIMKQLSSTMRATDEMLNNSLSIEPSNTMTFYMILIRSRHHMSIYENLSRSLSILKLSNIIKTSVCRMISIKHSLSLQVARLTEISNLYQIIHVHEEKPCRFDPIQK
jgi:hypothetical protein